MTLLVFGLDGEMTEANIADGGRMFQIGIAAHTGADGEPAGIPDTFSALFCPGRVYAWSPRAEGVHGYTQEEVEAAAPAGEVDEALCAWLLERGAQESSRGGMLAVGFNVGSFDMPHMALVLPRAHALFSRRTIDLNALCFTLDGHVYGGSPASWSGWKRMAKSYAERTIHASGRSGAEHDAGYDALLHLHAWRFLRAAVHGAPLPLPQVPVPAPQSQGLALAVLETFGAEQAGDLLGVHPEMLRGWAAGGRATRPGAVERMRALLDGGSTL